MAGESAGLWNQQAERQRMSRRWHPESNAKLIERDRSIVKRSE